MPAAAIYLLPIQAKLLTVISQTTNIESPEVNGTVSDPGAAVNVVIDGNSYVATNNGDGTWTIAAGVITPDLRPGDSYSVTATATIDGRIRVASGVIIMLGDVYGYIDDDEYGFVDGLSIQYEMN